MKYTDNRPEALFESNIALIEQIVKRTARRRGFSPDDAEEFAGWVWLRLIDNDYSSLRKFRGQSSLGTYLSVVIGHLARDFRNSQWGKWRPSAAANRLGPVAVELERLLYRDEFGFDAAAQMLLQHRANRSSRAQLEEIAAQLPGRTNGRRRQCEPVDSLETTGGVDRSLRNESRARIASRVEDALALALGELPPQDREVLRLRFFEGRTVVSIARELCLDQRGLYGRIQSCLALIRRRLEAQGLLREDLREIVDWPDSELALSRLLN